MKTLSFGRNKPPARVIPTSERGLNCRDRSISLPRYDSSEVRSIPASEIAPPVFLKKVSAAKVVWNFSRIRLFVLEKGLIENDISPNDIFPICGEKTIPNRGEADSVTKWLEMPLPPSPP